MTNQTETKIALSQSYTAHSQFNEVVLREPKFSEYIELGEVTELQPGPNGSPMLVRYNFTIEAYLKQICVSPSYEELAGLNLADSKKVTKAVEDFFTEAASSNSPPTNSLSDSKSE